MGYYKYESHPKKLKLKKFWGHHCFLSQNLMAKINIYQKVREKEKTFIGLPLHQHFGKFYIKA